MKIIEPFNKTPNPTFKDVLPGEIFYHISRREYYIKGYQGPSFRTQALTISNSSCLGGLHAVAIEPDDEVKVFPNAQLVLEP